MPSPKPFQQSTAAGCEDEQRPDQGETRVIWLVGMMGVGKSTIAPLLARALGRPTLDIDREVEREAKASIPEIFASRGEAAFRKLEAQAIEAARGSGAVVALGGGAMAQPGAPERLRSSGLVVYLKATPDELVTRIGNPDSRPLLKGLGSEQRRERLAELLAERESSYAQADLIVDVGSERFEEVARRLASELKNRNRSEPPGGSRV